MDEKGPADASGQKRDAVTTWTVKWSYEFDTSHERCTIASVRTTVDMRYQMPRWQDRGEITKSLQGRWDEYYAALQLHEEGHKEIAIQAANEIEEKVAKLDWQRSCGELEEEINKLANGIIESYRAKDTAYDEQTNHGRLQGAEFP